MNKCDLKIVSGEIIDGTNQPRYRSDIAIRDGVIVAIGDISDWQSDEIINAEGRIVAPGFIDVHTHDDRLLLADPSMTPKASQGVTTVVVGNCGVSLAPLVPVGAPIPPLNLLGDKDEYKYASFAEYTAALEATPAAVNAVSLIGHMTLRACVMDDLERPATTGEIGQMSVLLKEGLDAGCIGMSTGLAYPPSQHAPTGEVIALASQLKAAGGLYTTHMRNEGADVIKSIHETLLISKETGVEVVISHHKCSGRENWGKSPETLALISSAQRQARQGERPAVNLDAYPYTASSTVLLKSFVERAERVLISWSDPCPLQAGRDIADVMEDWDCDLDTAIERLLPAGAIYFQMDEGDLRRILSFPSTMIGSDGLPHDKRPHPRLWGTFPKVLGHYSRDEGLFSLEEAVHKMSGIPAGVFGLNRRGSLKQSHIADIVIFDADTVIDRASYNDPMQPAAGIDYVIVAGQLIWKGGASTGARPGKLVKRHTL